MKTNEKQKNTNSQPATQKPFFGAKPEQAFFSSAKEQSTPFFQLSATSKADVIGESVVQRMPAFESEVKDNGAVQRKFVNPSPIQAKLTIGEPGDKYEQEADRVASQVVEQINAPAPAQSNQGQTLQRMEEKPEELQAKPEITTLQRQEEKPEELQAKFTIQRREDIASGEASPDLTSAIFRARGGGQSLDAGLQRSMGQAMGADFSGVRVHTDAQADQLNRSIQAKAFTTGQDVFFRQGAYEPGSRGGQELIAHELTHVVQQNGRAVIQRTIQVNNRLIDIGRLRQNIGKNKTNQITQAINLADKNNTSTTDIPSMINTMVNLLRGKDKPAVKFTEQEEVNLADALGEQLSNFDTNTQDGNREATLFNQLIDISGAGASRSKGTPNMLGLANVPGVLNGKVNAASAQITAILGNLPGPGFWTVLQPHIDSKFIRTGYQNDKGWLPAVPMPAVPTPLQTDWDTYTASQSTYVEFTVDNSWRIVYNFINNTSYLTLHYNGHRGYNPFFTL